MPPQIESSLNGLLETLRQRYDTVEVRNTWRADHERFCNANNCTHKRYWRAAIRINGVETRWYYSYSRSQWKRS